MYCKSMYYVVYLIFLIISLTRAQPSFITNSLCAQYYPFEIQQQCDCENTSKGISLKCVGHSYVPHFLPNIQYHTIEFESCSQDLQIGDKTFADLNINSLRLRHCNLVNLNEESFSKINHLEKLYIENSTINSLATSSGNFQDVFYSDSFKVLKGLTLKKIHYHQVHKHDTKLNLEILLTQLPQLNRLELSEIFIDNYRFHNLTSIGNNLTYLKLVNTHQTTLLPIEHLKFLQNLVLMHLPQLFHRPSLISSLKHLKNLKYIDFAYDQLSNIDGLQSSTIDQIDLSSNLIEYIDEYTFEGVPKLRRLILIGNPLQYIDKNAFCGIEKLAHLDINVRKPNQLSPLDGCLLLNYPNLDIKQDSQTKAQCDCQLMNIFKLKMKKEKDINRLFKPEHSCLVTNNTLFEAAYYQQLKNHLNLPMPIYDLDKYLNCTSDIQCDRLCQDRKLKSTTTPIDTEKTNAIVQKKHTSVSTSLYSFFSYVLSLLLLAFLYL
ncbi:unnamed protein product [Rotaria socialis]|uniref:Uncharacterized protein n=4 Tax=Rotaria socialis TaxID=392032 RepID=A0A817U6H6_9BILA|nr:unnamed protein product [Rotaria socialis]